MARCVSVSYDDLLDLMFTTDVRPIFTINIHESHPTLRRFQANLQSCALRVVLCVVRAHACGSAAFVRASAGAVGREGCGQSPPARLRAHVLHTIFCVSNTGIMTVSNFSSRLRAARLWRSSTMSLIRARSTAMRRSIRESTRV